MKKCPFCAEEIQEEAVKCKHCGEFIIDAELKRFKDSGSKWFHKTSFVVISVLCVGPLALPLVWFNPQYKIATKVVVTILVITLTVGLCVASVGLYANLLKQLESVGM
jgi:predicted nucleic acid-binding Zn ribbon protein